MFLYLLIFLGFTVIVGKVSHPFLFYYDAQWYLDNFEFIRGLQKVVALVLTFIFIGVDNSNIVVEQRKGSRFLKVLLITVTLGLAIYFIRRTIKDFKREVM